MLTAGIMQQMEHISMHGGGFIHLCIKERKVCTVHSNEENLLLHESTIVLF